MYVYADSDDEQSDIWTTANNRKRKLRCVDSMQSVPLCTSQNHAKKSDTVSEHPIPASAFAQVAQGKNCQTALSTRTARLTTAYFQQAA